eukprot:3216_1
MATESIQKEGYLVKISKHIWQKRKRYIVLKSDYLYSYKNKNKYEQDDKPTERINLKRYTTTKHIEETRFAVIDWTGKNQITRDFIADSINEMNSWINIIRDVQCNTPNTNVSNLNEWINIHNPNSINIVYKNICVEKIQSSKPGQNSKTEEKQFSVDDSSHTLDNKEECDQHIEFNWKHKRVTFFMNLFRINVYFDNEKLKEIILRVNNTKTKVTQCTEKLSEVNNHRYIFLFAHTIGVVCDLADMNDDGTAMITIYPNFSLERFDNSLWKLRCIAEKAQKEGKHITKEHNNPLKEKHEYVYNDMIFEFSGNDRVLLGVTHVKKDKNSKDIDPKNIENN